MNDEMVSIRLQINGEDKDLQVESRAFLLSVLRRERYVSVKKGCDDGTCGVCVVLLDGEPVRSCKVKAVQAAGHAITTVEGLSKDGKLHPIQQAFLDTGAIQCGFCTPAEILCTKALLDRNPNPSDDEIRDALDGVLCRCTGYVRIVEAVHRAAAMMRGEAVGPIVVLEQELPKDINDITLPDAFYRHDGGRVPLPQLVFTPPEMEKTRVIGKPEVKVDGVKLACGRAVFTDDIKMEGMLYGALLTSPHAHARIINIDVSKARAMPGVHAVLTYKDLPRVKYASGGQSYPNPLPYDQVCLDNKVRHEGDRVWRLWLQSPRNWPRRRYV
jgi:putative selenate reductase molybdopterin-binding subunit